MATIDLEEMREIVELARELERIADKVTPMLELIKELKDKRALIPPVTDRFITSKEAAKILKVGNGTIATLVKRGQLNPLYVADSRAKKIRLSEVMKIVEGRS